MCPSTVALDSKLSEVLFTLSPVHPGDILCLKRVPCPRFTEESSESVEGPEEWLVL